jgi:GNAT superfamily N-acetyltransferase
VSSANAKTPAGLRIDRATEQDVPLLLALIRELAEYERLADQVIATEAVMRESLFREPRGADAVIARVEGEPVGYALWFYTFSTFLGKRGLYLEDLFVKPAWRGKGVGRALLAHLAGEAVARDCGRLEWSVLDWNEPAIGFYKGLGARPMGEWTVFRLTGEALNALAERAVDR